MFNIFCYIYYILSLYILLKYEYSNHIINIPKYKYYKYYRYSATNLELTICIFSRSLPSSSMSATLWGRATLRPSCKYLSFQKFGQNLFSLSYHIVTDKNTEYHMLSYHQNCHPPAILQIFQFEKLRFKSLIRSCFLFHIIVTDNTQYTINIIKIATFRP